MRLLGVWPAVACLAVSLAVVPVNLLVLRTQTKLRRQTLVHSDARVKLTGEVLSGRAPGWANVPCSGCLKILHQGIVVLRLMQCCLVQCCLVQCCLVQCCMVLADARQTRCCGPCASCKHQNTPPLTCRRHPGCQAVCLEKLPLQAAGIKPATLSCRHQACITVLLA